MKVNIWNDQLPIGQRAKLTQRLRFRISLHSNFLSGSIQRLHALPVLVKSRDEIIDLPSVKGAVKI